MKLVSKMALLAVYSTILSAGSDYSTLGNKRYNEVTFPCSHNAQSDKGATTKTWIPVQNQERTILQQLNAGIRGLKLPLYWQGNSVLACHGINQQVINNVKSTVDARIAALHLPRYLIGIAKKIVEALLPKILANIYFHPEKVKPCDIDPGMESFISILSTIHIFLDQNPSEIVTLFLEVWLPDKTTAPKQIFDLCARTGAYTFLYQQPDNQPWPTLNELISTNKRLIVFLDINVNQALYPFNMYTNAAAWSSPYNFSSIGSLKNDKPSRGPSSTWRNKANKIWLLQHFVSSTTSGSPSGAQEVNKEDVIIARVAKYKRAFAIGNPNFIWVDFFNRPASNGIFDAVDRLNGVQ